MSDGGVATGPLLQEPTHCCRWALEAKCWEGGKGQALITFQSLLNNKYVLVCRVSSTIKVHMDWQRVTRSMVCLQESKILFSWAEKNVVGLKVKHLYGLTKPTD